MRRPGVPERLRGTYAGFSSRANIEALKQLGITATELLPVQAFMDDSHLRHDGLTNYWGYNSIGFFMPETRYAQNPVQARHEFREMVATLHDAGIEVILDVVYNHTAEGNERGPTLCFKGIDNASYYRLMPDNPRYYINDSGAGNCLNINSPFVLRMVMDSLRYWTDAMDADGFRFDLATVLGRQPEGFDPDHPFLQAVQQDPQLRRIKLIAEPWDCGPGGYQTGGFAPGWAEWNDQYRDTVRDFWRAEAPASAFATRFCGSEDIYAPGRRQPWESVNFVTAHDGFTLHDLVSYNKKHNQKNKEKNKDGHSDNRSWNCGTEGHCDDPGILALRERQIKNFLATLLLSIGTPMIMAGDESMNSQGGNNNSYCQDNETGWVLWQDDDTLRQFAVRLIAFRKAHAVFAADRFLTSDDAAWVHPAGRDITQDDWGDEELRCFGLMLKKNNPPILILFSNANEHVLFSLPEHTKGWVCAFDTNAKAGFPEKRAEPATQWSMAPFSLVVFTGR
jgi:glycogen operon protein